WRTWAGRSDSLSDRLSFGPAIGSGAGGSPTGPRFFYAGGVTVQVVLVHRIRTSATMWRSQASWLDEHGIPAHPVDLPGHGSRMAEPFTLEEALLTIDSAVRHAAQRGPVLLVGHSMGGLLSLEYTGSADI